jgi:hypothetical protein
MSRLARARAALADRLVDAAADDSRAALREAGNE